MKANPRGLRQSELKIRGPGLCGQRHAQLSLGLVKGYYDLEPATGPCIAQVEPVLPATWLLDPISRRPDRLQYLGTDVRGYRPSMAYQCRSGGDFFGVARPGNCASAARARRAHQQGVQGGAPAR